MFNQDYILKQLDYYFSGSATAQEDALYRIASNAQCEIGIGALRPDYLTNEQVELVKHWVWEQFGEEL